MKTVAELLADLADLPLNAPVRVVYEVLIQEETSYERCEIHAVRQEGYEVIISLE
ncbi:MAG TPA: hypothetical protein VIJ87_01215 [Pyrinomonadaceae bacterium]